MKEMILVPPTTFAIRVETWTSFAQGLISPASWRATWHQVYTEYGQRPVVGYDQVWGGIELICIAVYLRIPMIECEYRPDFQPDQAADRIAEIFRNARRTADSIDSEPGSLKLGTLDGYGPGTMGPCEIKSARSNLLRIGSGKRRSTRGRRPKT